MVLQNSQNVALIFNYGIKHEATKFAALSKLGEIFIESLPQYITQFLMVSAKGSREGFREFTESQRLSVITSGISISMGIASFMVQQRPKNLYIQNQFHSLASFVSIIAFVVSEIAFLSCVARFTFASDLTFRLIPKSGGQC
jgi:hypothetical protein